MTVLIRIALAVLFVVELVVGAWNAIAPRSFYNNFPTVDLTPPFSEHFARDFGFATLGIAFLLLIALIAPKAHYVIPAVLAYSFFSIPHFFFHLAHLDNATGAQAAFLIGGNALVALLGVTAIVLTIVRDRQASARPVSDLERLRAELTR
jgi:hypothetical protein